MGSYEGSSDWDDLPSRESFEAFKPVPAAQRPDNSGAKAAKTKATDPGLDFDARTDKKRLNAVFAFDTTGSMTPWIENVAQKMEYLAAGLLKLLDMEISLVGVGDHGDGRNFLQIKHFSRDLEALKKNIQELAPTDGQDTPEGLECLFKVMNALELDVPTVLVLITDSIPHGMEGYEGVDDGCPFGVSWEVELEELRTRFKNVYLVTCATDPHILALQKKLVAGNSFLQLNDFWRFTNLVMALCMDEVGELDYFLTILERQRGGSRKDEVLSLLGRPKAP
jgi:hypothetical protein